MHPTVSIIICTKNRVDSLVQTLASIGKANVPADWEVELLVVDNGSTDATCKVVTEVKLKNLRLRCVSEPRAGLSRARNTGVRETKGRVILFTDDDTRVPSNWIEGMCRPILEGQADALAGGVRFPAVIEALPAFKELTVAQRGWLASTEGINQEEPERMVGANMSFSRHILEPAFHQGGLPVFDEDLGAGASGAHEETLFSYQIKAKGYRLKGALDVAVDHYFDTSRLTAAGMRSSARNIGRGGAHLFHHWEHQRSFLALYWLLRSWLKCRKQLPGMAGLKAEKDLAFYCEYLRVAFRRFKYSPQWYDRDSALGV